MRRAPGARGATCGVRECGAAGCGLSSSGMQGSEYCPLPPLFLPANSPARSCTIFPLPADLQSFPPTAYSGSLTGPREPRPQFGQLPRRLPPPPRGAELGPATAGHPARAPRNRSAAFLQQSTQAEAAAPRFGVPGRPTHTRPGRAPQNAVVPTGYTASDLENSSPGDSPVWGGLTGLHSSLRPPPTAQARGRPVPGASCPRVLRPLPSPASPLPAPAPR